MKTGFRFVWIAVTAMLLLAMTACTTTTSPTPTPTKAPAEAPAKAAEPTKPPAVTPTAPPKALEPIKLGYISSSSGYVAPIGQPQRQTVAMFEEKINQEGGINGRPLRITYYDDESDDTKGVLAMKKLIDTDKVLAVVGVNFSGIAVAVSIVAEEAKMPFFASNSSRASVEPNKKWVFKMPTGESRDGFLYYKFMKDRGLKKVALLNNTVATGREGRKFILATLAQSGLTLVSNEEYDVTATDIKPQLTKIKAAGPEALILWGAEAAGAMAVRQARELGMDIPIIGGLGLGTPAIRNVKELADGIEGLYLAGYSGGSVWESLPDTDPKKKLNAELAQMLKAKYNRPISDWDAIARDSLMVTVDAIRAANPDPTKVEEARAQIRDALERTKNFVGALVRVDGYSPTEHEGVPNLADGLVQQIRKGEIVIAK